MSAMIQEQYVEIGIGEERYAVPIQDIQEVIRWTAITRIPRSSRDVKGIINVRGKVVPVICLSSRFGLGEVPHSKSTRILIINHAEERIGMIVNRVNQVITLSDIQPNSENFKGTDRSWIAGYGHTANGLVCILKLEQILKT